jgi:hypothetical protein
MAKSEKWGIVEWGAAAGVVGVVGVVIALLTYLGVDPFAGNGNPAPRPVATTRRPSITPSSSPAPTASTDKSIPPKPVSAHYLMDLSALTPGPFEGSYSEGVVSLGGKQYRKSFFESACIVVPIVVSLPEGMTDIHGIVGYTDDSANRSGDASGNPFQVEIDETTEPAGQNDQWTRIWLGTLPEQGVTRFNVPIDPGVKALQLTPVNYACSTEIGWGNPIVK